MLFLTLVLGMTDREAQRGGERHQGQPAQEASSVSGEAGFGRGESWGQPGRRWESRQPAGRQRWQSWYEITIKGLQNVTLSLIVLGKCAIALDSQLAESLMSKKKETPQESSEETLVGCTVKELPEKKQAKAVQTAVEENPANRPRVGMLSKLLDESMIEEVTRPAFLSVLTTKYWGSAGKKLGVSFLENTAPGTPRPYHLSHERLEGILQRRIFLVTKPGGGAHQSWR
jgi:hypothetical protein